MSDLPREYAIGGTSSDDINRIGFTRFFRRIREQIGLGGKLIVSTVMQQAPERITRATGGE